ncbi:NRDE family protein [Kitasatospora sp. NPDC088134]|uniref:NRDE family protein n=1 Tax=Kitasatospora sp. NPDC088134 TaxID=3364071 RepID=UPI003829D914
MCTVFVSVDPGSAVPVLVLAVRDEYTDRGWLPPGRHWPDRPGVVGGLDLDAGGTWLAVAPGAGREAVAACLLNGFGHTADPQRRLSRGGLPLIAVSGQPVDQVERYDPFHLVVARPSGVRVVSWDGSSVEESELPAGLSAILNDGPEGRRSSAACPPGILATMNARLARFRARLQAAARPEPASGPPEVAWGPWLPIARGDGLPPDDPAALIRLLTPPGGRVWGSVSLSLIALSREGIRYDFGAVSEHGPSPRVGLETVLDRTVLSTSRERTPMDKEPSAESLAEMGAQMEAWLVARGHSPSIPASTADAPKWQRDMLTVLSAAEAAGVLRKCPHLTPEPQPAAVMAEAPDLLLCLPCYSEVLPRRVCPDCRKPSGSASLEGGVEDVRRGPLLIYSRMRCAQCAWLKSPTGPEGTFGA